MSLILDGTNGLSDVDGSAATPAIRGTDANTGIFFPAADTIAFAEGGVEAMRLDASGNLLVGTTNGIGKLAISPASGTGFASTWDNTFVTIAFGGTSTSTGLAFSVNTSTNTTQITSLTPGISWRDLKYKASQHIWEAGASQTEAVRIDSSGNLGVGTTSPSSYGKLAVFGNAALNTNGQLKLYNSANNNWSLIDNPSTDSSALLRFSSGSGEAMRITSDGNLLVGTTSNSLAKVRVVSGSNNWAFQSNDIYRVFNKNAAFGSTSTTRTCSIDFASQGSNWSGHLVEVIFAGAYDVSGTVIAGKATFAVVTLTVLGVNEIQDIGQGVSFSAAASGTTLVVTATTTSLTNWTGWTVRVTSTNSFSAPTSISIA